jgi:hypothetical protein
MPEQRMTLSCRTLASQLLLATFPLLVQLAQIGIPHSRGYSYWERGQNDVSAFLFSGMPLTKVGGIREALAKLEGNQLARNVRATGA